MMAVLLLLTAAGCGPAHMHLIGPVTYTGKKIVGTIVVEEGGEVVLDFQGKRDIGGHVDDPETPDAPEPPE